MTITENGEIMVSVAEHFASVHNVAWLYADAMDFYPLAVGEDGQGQAATLNVANLRRDAVYEDSVRLVILSFIAWAEDEGTIYTRSNCASLARDYPEMWVYVCGVSGFSNYEALALRADAEIPQSLAESLTGLADEYPIYSSEHVAELETQLAHDAWEDFLQYDVPREIEGVFAERFGGNWKTDRPDVARQWAQTPREHLRKRFYALLSDRSDPYETESATLITFPGQKDIVTTMAEEIIANGVNA